MKSTKLKFLILLIFVGIIKIESTSDNNRFQWAHTVIFISKQINQLENSLANNSQKLLDYEWKKAKIGNLTLVQEIIATLPSSAFNNAIKKLFQQFYNKIIQIDELKSVKINQVKPTIDRIKLLWSNKDKINKFLNQIKNLIHQTNGIKGKVVPIFKEKIEQLEQQIKNVHFEKIFEENIDSNVMQTEYFSKIEPLIENLNALVQRHEEINGTFLQLNSVIASANSIKTDLFKNLDNKIKELLREINYPHCVSEILVQSNEFSVDYRLVIQQYIEQLKLLLDNADHINLTYQNLKSLISKANSIKKTLSKEFQEIIEEILQNIENINFENVVEERHQDIIDNKYINLIKPLANRLNVLLNNADKIDEINYFQIKCNSYFQSMRAESLQTYLKKIIDDILVMNKFYYEEIIQQENLSDFNETIHRMYPLSKTCQLLFDNIFEIDKTFRLINTSSYENIHWDLIQHFLERFIENFQNRLENLIISSETMNKFIVELKQEIKNFNIYLIKINKFDQIYVKNENSLAKLRKQNFETKNKFLKNQIGNYLGQIGSIFINVDNATELQLITFFNRVKLFSGNYEQIEKQLTPLNNLLEKAYEKSQSSHVIGALNQIERNIGRIIRKVTNESEINDLNVNISEFLKVIQLLMEHGHQMEIYASAINQSIDAIQWKFVDNVFLKKSINKSIENYKNIHLKIENEETFKRFLIKLHQFSLYFDRIATKLAIINDQFNHADQSIKNALIKLNKLPTDKILFTELERSLRNVIVTEENFTNIEYSSQVTDNYFHRFNLMLRHLDLIYENEEKIHAQIILATNSIERARNIDANKSLEEYIENLARKIQNILMEIHLIYTDGDLNEFYFQLQTTINELNKIADNPPESDSFHSIAFCQWTNIILIIVAIIILM